MCQGSDSLLGPTAGGPVMDLGNIPDLKPLCYSASKLFADSSSSFGAVGVVKHEPGVSGTVASGGGVAGSNPAATHHTHHHHHMLHPATYHHGYHGYDPGAIASLHHTAVSHS
jgi:hypothetical protein